MIEKGKIFLNLKPSVKKFLLCSFPALPKTSVLEYNTSKNSNILPLTSYQCKLKNKNPVWNRIKSFRQIMKTCESRKLCQINITIHVPCNLTPKFNITLHGSKQLQNNF